LHFRDERGASIDYGYDVFQIATSEEVALPATLEGFEFRGEQKRCRHHSDRKMDPSTQGRAFARE
jgi:hypothetical protein